MPGSDAFMLWPGWNVQTYGFNYWQISAANAPNNFAGYAGFIALPGTGTTSGTVVERAVATVSGSGGLGVHQ